MSEKPIRELFAKAGESLHAAKVLLDAGHPDFAASRAYYAMFYTAQAMLLTRDEHRSKHSGVIAAFGEFFVKPGVVEYEHFKWLREAFDVRNAGDYALLRIEPARARELIAAAGRFVEECRRQLLDKGFVLDEAP